MLMNNFEFVSKITFSKARKVLIYIFTRNFKNIFINFVNLLDHDFLNYDLL